MRIAKLDAIPPPCTDTENTRLVSSRSEYPLNCPVSVNGAENVVIAPSGAPGTKNGSVVNVKSAVIHTDEYVVPFTCS